MKHAIIYCRVSTEEQAEDGHHSLSAQETTCRKAASDQEYEVAAVFRDPGKSATNMKRPGLRDAIARCQQDSSIKALFVQDTDRLARNTQDHLTIRALLQKAGVKLVSASQPMLEDSAEGRMIDTIIASVNQFQSDITARKTLKGLEEKARNGGWPRPAPLGYQNAGVGEGEKERIVVVDSDAAPLVRRAFEMFATGAYPMYELRELLHSQGLRSRTGGKLHLSKLHWMLRNPFYVGEIHWRNIRAKGKHKPLVTREVFETVQQVFKAHGGGRARPRKYHFPLNGYVYCALCGRQMSPEHHIRKRVTYYRCHKRGGCQPCVRDTQLELEAVEAFRAVDLPDQFVSAVTGALERSILSHRMRVREIRAAHLSRKARLEEKRKILEKKWLERVVSDDDFTRIRDGIDAEIGEIDVALGRIQANDMSGIDASTEVLKFTRNMADSYATGSLQTKQLMLKFAWRRFEIDQKRIINAEPTPVIQLLLGQLENSRNTHKPVQNERASVPKGGCHPNHFMSNSVVRTRHGWGPKSSPIRPQIVVERWARNQPLLDTLLNNPPFLKQAFELVGLIRQSLKAQDTYDGLPS